MKSNLDEFLTNSPPEEENMKEDKTEETS